MGVLYLLPAASSFVRPEPLKLIFFNSWGMLKDKAYSNYLRTDDKPKKNPSVVQCINFRQENFARRWTTQLCVRACVCELKEIVSSTFLTLRQIKTQYELNHNEPIIVSLDKGHNGTAASSTQPGDMRNVPSKKWQKLSDKIMTLYYETLNRSVREYACYSGRLSHCCCIHTNVVNIRQAAVWKCVSHVK